MTVPAPSILVVDDDADTCRNLTDILEECGYVVETACDGPSALSRVRSRRFDVALLDFKMPGMNGLELYREIKRLQPSTVAIIVSAYAGGETVPKAHAAGAWQVLTKPVELTRLLPLIEEAVEQPLILVVDDDPDLCASLWDLLRARGYRVGIAHDELQAVDLMRDTLYRVVLLDMKLPRGNGQTLYRAVRQLSPDSRVILVTGFRTELDSLVRRVLGEGADAICYKPFNLPELLETVHRLADERPETPTQT